MPTAGDRIHDVEKEEGAVAIVVAILLTVLLGLSAFAVDFGLSYTSTNSLQTASDAASLAAVSTYVDEDVSCVGGTLTSTGPRSLAAMEADAQVAADEVMRANHRDAGVEPGSFRVECDGGSVVANWASTATTDAMLGGVFGRSEIGGLRDATAALSVPGTVDRVRPYAICTDDVPDTIPSAVVKVRYPGNTMSGSTCPASSGGWLTLECPVVGAVDQPDEGGGQPALSAATRDGCTNPVSVVPNQSSVPTVRYAQHLLACNPPLNTPDEDCLAVQTGNVSDSDIWAAWNGLLGEQINLPVICGQPECFPAVQIGGGNNARHPVQRLVGVTVCGYHWGSGNQKHGDTQAGVCAGSDASTGGNNAASNYLLLAFDTVQTAGSVGESSCVIGDPTCDGGLRRTLLVE